MPTENERQLARYLEEIGQGEIVGGRRWIDDADEVRVIPRRPLRTAAATRKREETSDELAQRAQAMRAAGMRWKAIGAKLDRDPQHLQRLVRRAKGTGISRRVDETS